MRILQSGYREDADLRQIDFASAIYHYLGIKIDLSPRPNENLVSWTNYVIGRDRNAVDGRPDGVLVIAMPPPAREMKRLLDARVPVVLVDFGHPAFTNTYIDNVAGGYIATRHLIELGHRRIAYIGDPSINPYGFISSVDRCVGFRRAMAESDLEIPATYIKEGPHARHVAHRLTAELLNLKEPPTAVVAASDTQALGVLDGANNLGVEVPHQLSVIGFDDIEVAAYVGLTTVRQPLVLSGQRGAELLLEAIAAPHPLPTPIAEQLPIELIVRKSTAPPKLGADDRRQR